MFSVSTTAGRPEKVAHDIQCKAIKVFIALLKDQGSCDPTATSLKQILRDRFNTRVCLSTCCDILRNFGFVYTEKFFGQKKTANKHTLQRCEETKKYILTCLFYESLEKFGKCHNLNHDESWIECKPSYHKSWRCKGVDVKYRHPSGRLAFAALYNRYDGIINLIDKKRCDEDRMKAILTKFGSETEKSAEKFLEIADSSMIEPFVELPHHKSKNNRNSGKRPNSTYFCFRVYSSGHLESRQMDGQGFLYSIDHMMRTAHRFYSNDNSPLVLHLDNASYHR